MMALNTNVCPQCNGFKKPQFSVCYKCDQKRNGQQRTGSQNLQTNQFAVDYGADYESVGEKLFFDMPLEIAAAFRIARVSFGKLRAYYGEITRIWRLIENDKNRVEQGKMEFKLLLARAKYDQSRNVMPFAVVEFLNKNEQMIAKGDFRENFGIFKKHFEAVIALCKGELKS
jgi:CRISPR type III-A-associated protein Csm2